MTRGGGKHLGGVILVDDFLQKHKLPCLNSEFAEFGQQWTGFTQPFIEKVQAPPLKSQI
jgi:hypothetical protein